MTPDPGARRIAALIVLLIAALTASGLVALIKELLK